MNKHPIPTVFRQLLNAGYLEETDLLTTRDGFYLAYRSLADLLAQRGILDVPDSAGNRLACNNYFDDWFLYALPDTDGHICSLLKLREQEHDLEQEVPADGDMPGVTICFISFGARILLDCLENPSEENRQQLNAEINRVVARRGQRHHDALKRYFVNPASEAPYLVASLYAKHIAAFAGNGQLPVPNHYAQIVRSYDRRRNSAKLGRLPRFIAQLNREAGYVVCDNQTIFIRDAASPNRYECAAILATHTGNTSLYSFAAEVEYHARFLTPVARLKLPLLGKSVYDSAIRADMTVGDTEYEGPAPFYRPNSRIVKRQYHHHKDNY